MRERGGEGKKRVGRIVGKIIGEKGSRGGGKVIID
jgi:hypothetical protein